jgi:hypothetical protein
MLFILYIIACNNLRFANYTILSCHDNIWVVNLFKKKDFRNFRRREPRRNAGFSFWKKPSPVKARALLFIAVLVTW